MQLWKLNSSSNGALTGCEAATAPANVTRYATGMAMYTCPSVGPIRVKHDTIDAPPDHAMSDYAANGGTAPKTPKFGWCGSPPMSDEDSPVVCNGNGGQAVSGIIRRPTSLKAWRPRCSWVRSARILCPTAPHFRR